MLTTCPAADETNDGAVASSIETDGPAPSALPDLSSARRSGLSDGQVAAAVVVPILAALALFAALLLWRRRRRDRGTPPPAFFPAMMEKFGRHSSSRATSTPGPVLTSPSNNAYYTGLDNSSHGSRPSDSPDYYAPGTLHDPPPPYNASKAPQLPPAAPFATALSLPSLREPEPVVRTRSPFDDPVSPLADDGNDQEMGGDYENWVMPVEAAALPSRSNTINRAPSISSTQYSDTASVHSARAARMSVGGPQMVMGSSPPAQRSLVSRGGEETPNLERQRSLFDDPASPVSSFASLDAGRRTGSVVSAELARR